MVQLRVEPAEAIGTCEELMAVAASLEQQAAQRYRELAGRCGRGNAPELATLLSELADRAEEEERRLAARSHPASPAEPRSPPAGVFDDEGLASASPALVSRYRVLSTAVRNEERAFAFWSYLAAHARTPDIQRAAEGLAHRELEQVAALRRQRRLAFRAERSQPASTSPADPLAQAESRLLARLQDRAAGGFAPDREGLAELVTHGRDNLATLDRMPEIESAGGAVTMPQEVDELAMAEFLLEAYLDVADRSQDEELVREAQRMAGRSINRLTWLRQHHAGRDESDQEV
jgi:rubrerythrin